MVGFEFNLKKDVWIYVFTVSLEKPFFQKKSNMQNFKKYFLNKPWNLTQEFAFLLFSYSNF